MGVNGLDRRTFAKMIVGAAVTVPAIVEAAVKEAKTVGTISDDTALTLLRHIGYEPTLPDEMKKLKPMLERTIKDLQAIRDFEIPFTLEPALVFRAGK